MGDSAFRRLLLDTVSAVVTQPPSTSSLVELLRIATPSLLAASSDVEQRRRAEAAVRTKARREKMFRTLQLRIHPDKHPGDERATKLFQDVTDFYGKCVDAMGREDRTGRSPGGGANDVAPSGRDATTKERNARWRDQIPRRPATAGTSTHSGYENYNAHDQSDPRRRGLKNDARRDARPRDHRLPALAAVVLCPPLGLCALNHSFQVEMAWDEGRRDDARDHSERALDWALYGYLACGCCVLLFLLGGGDGPDSWRERIRHSLPWNDGP